MKYIAFLSLAFVLSATNVSAQGFFGKLKNAVKEHVQSAVNQQVSKVNDNVAAAVTGNNPFSDAWHIDEIKAYGTKTSKNFGKVWLVIKAEAIIPLQYGYVALGGALDNTYAVIGGKTYKPYDSVGHRFEMPEGVPMELDSKNCRSICIENVPATATEIQAYNMYIYIDPNRHKTVLWKNIPITWND